MPVASTLAHPQLALLAGVELSFAQGLELLAGLDMVGKFDLFGRCEKWHTTDGAQVPADRVGTQPPSLA